MYVGVVRLKEPLQLLIGFSLSASGPLPYWLITVNKNNFLICFCSFELSCPILETFVYCIVLLNIVLFLALFVSRYLIRQYYIKKIDKIIIFLFYN